MWGYGDRHDALSVGVLDPLYADALVIQAGEKKIAIVGLDLGRAPAEASLERIRARIKEQAGIENSIIAGSHTHHGPVLELTGEEGKGKGRFDAALRYYGQMEDGIVAAIVEANSRLAPARMAVGSAQLEGFNRNRHTKIEPKPSDRELAVMRFDDAAGKPVAMVVNFAAHPTMLPSGMLKFSADYVGALKAEVTKETGAAAIFMQGAAGDQSVNAGDKDYQAFGQALAREAVKLAQSLSPQDAGARVARLPGRAAAIRRAHGFRQSDGEGGLSEGVFSGVGSELYRQICGRDTAAADGGAAEWGHRTGGSVGRVLQRSCDPAEAAGAGEAVVFLRVCEWVSPVFSDDRSGGGGRLWSG